MPVRRFFFYGTLSHASGTAIAHSVLARMTAPRRTWVRGRLFAVRERAGWYPVLVPGRGHVFGFMHRAAKGFSHATLRQMDAWEAFDPRAPHRSDYVRRPVRTGTGLVAQVYCWNRPVGVRMRPVPGGDFAAFVGKRGLPVYGER